MAQPATAEVTAHVGMQTAGHQASRAPDTRSTSPGDHSWAISEPAGPGAMTGLMAMCLAILCGILAAFAAVLLGHLGRRPLARTTRAIRALVVAGRDRDPPCLVRLSVMRC